MKFFRFETWRKKQERHYNYNPRYIHHRSAAYLYGREIVFGIQDGMVSALGAITGIAVGTQDHFTILLSGLAIISMSSISMAIGTFTSLFSQKRMEKRMLREELSEIRRNISAEIGEMEKRFTNDGWPKEIAREMSLSAGENEKLMLTEMAYRELSISPRKNPHPIKNSIAMMFSWIVGGAFPLSAYFFLPVEKAIVVSICVTLGGLFLLGIITSIYTKENPLRAGLRILIFSGLAIFLGYTIGHYSNEFIIH